MVRRNVIKLGWLIFAVTVLSCNRRFCESDNFYSIYQTRFEADELKDETVKIDLENKKKIFSTLCLSKNLKKILIVESRSGLDFTYSRGILFTFDDAKTYYYQIKKGKIRTGKGSDVNVDLNKILSHVKKDFSGDKKTMDKDYSDISDADYVNVVLYDSLMPRKFDDFQFPLFKKDSLLSK